MSKRKPFLLRLPPELHEELRRWAESEMRSLNGQIEYLLRDALRRRHGAGEELPPDKAVGDGEAGGSDDATRRTS